MDTDKLRVNIVNLSSRPERKKHILSQFENRNEFSIKIISAVVHEIGAIGLWLTIQHILRNELNQEDDFFIFCEDDHQFTDNYSKELLFNCIEEAKNKDADILSGGISWFHAGIQVSEKLFWVETFTGLQFTIIFKKFYNSILNADFKIGDDADLKISLLTEKKFLIFPFISIQKEFGYSDVTAKNNEAGSVIRLFTECSECLDILKDVKKYYFPNFK